MLIISPKDLVKFRKK